MEKKFDTQFIGETVEKTPFADTPAQKFFAEWCEINDSIAPQFVERAEWEKRGIRGILEKNELGKQTLFLPKDLHLWEMMDVIETVDHDTLARTPEKRTQRADRIRELGTVFEKAGRYLSEYAPILADTEGKPVAEEIAREFHRYGLSLQQKEREDDRSARDDQLTEEDKTKLDEWFLGGEAYQKRLARLGENPSGEQKEELRKNILSIYFKALCRDGYKADGEKPWKTKTGPRRHLQDRTRRQIIKAVETPEREMKTTIFKRGVEKLVTEMREPGWRMAVNNLLKRVGFDPMLEQRRLYDTLRIKDLKQELEEVRQTGDLAMISAKELDIARKIQIAVSRFPYGDNSDRDTSSNNPAKMVETQFINCVGSSILGGSLLDELGIKYLHADLPTHSVTVLVTADGRMYWQDFTPPGKSEVNYREITPDMLENRANESNPHHIPDSGRTIIFKNWQFKDRQLRVNLFKPEIGLQTHVLNNTGSVLNDLNRKEEAIEAYRQAINFDQRSASPYNGLGNALYDLGRNEEAMEAYRQAIEIDPQGAHPYNGLGNSLNTLGRNEEAMEAYRQTIEIDPQYYPAYNGLGNALSALGRKAEAVEAYRQSIEIDPQYDPAYNGLGNALSALGRKEGAVESYKKFIELSNGDDYWTNRAKRRINELQNETRVLD